MESMRDIHTSICNNIHNYSTEFLIAANECPLLPLDPFDDESLLQYTTYVNTNLEPIKAEIFGDVKSERNILMYISVFPSLDFLRRKYTNSEECFVEDIQVLPDLSVVVITKCNEHSIVTPAICIKSNRTLES